MKTIFVSSTFNDMQYERDAIQEIAMPQINATARKYGESVSFCDLRWGVNTTTLESEEGSKKVLDVCLNEIDRCRPYMIVILGERYGWIPDSQLIGSVAASKELDLSDLEMSVTALEIEYGALSSAGNLDNTLFYFREFESEIPSEYSAEDAVHQNKLNELKVRIDKLSGGKTRHYAVSWDGNKLHGIDQFASMLASDVSSLLEPEWIRKSTLSDFEKDRLIHDEFVDDTHKLFCIRDEVLDELINDIAQKKKLIRIDGTCGSGKSVLLARLAKRICEDYDVLFYACGISAMSTSSSSIQDGIIAFIENVLSKPHHNIDLDDDFDAFSSYILALYREYDESGRHLVLIVDGLEKLLATETRDKLGFLPRPSELKNCSFVISSTGLHVPVVGNLKDEWFPILDEWSATKLININDEITEDEKRKVLNNILHANNKELDRSVIDYIVKSKKINSLYEINLIVSGLLSMNKEDFTRIKQYGNGMDAINRYQKEIIDTFPEDEEQLSCLLLVKFAKSMGLHFIEEALRYIAVSRFGLLETDLKYLVEGYNTLDFIHFTTYFNDFFIQRYDGRYDFAHHCVRNGIVKNIEDQSVYSKRIILALSKRDDDVKLQEITHQFILADDKEGFVDYVKEWREYIYPQYGKELRRAADKAWYFAARALYEHCENDGGKWIADLINNTEGVNQTFIYFLNSQFRRYLDDNRDNKMVDTKIKVYEAIFMYTSKGPAEKIEETDRQHNVVKSLAILAQATLERGTKNDIATGLKYFKHYIKLIEILAQGGDQVYCLADLPSFYSHVTLFTDKIDEPEAMKFTLDILEKKFRVESSKEYETAHFEIYSRYRDYPDLYYYTEIAIKLGTEEAIKNAISLQLWEIQHRQKDLSIYGYSSQESRYMNLIDLYRRLNAEDVDERIMECCKKVAVLMDTYITLEKDPRELVGTYFKGYMDLIKQLYEQKKTIMLNLALEYCKKITQKILPQKTILGNLNDVIMEISQMSGEIYSALDEHEDSAACFEIVAQIREINLAKGETTAFWMSDCYSNLAKEYMQLQGDEYLNKAIECYEKVLRYRTIIFEQKSTCDNFELLIFARDNLMNAKLKAGLFSPMDVIRYKCDSVKLMEEKVAADSKMKNLIYSIRTAWQSIISFCLSCEGNIPIDTCIDAQKEYLNVLIRIIDIATQDNDLRKRTAHLKKLRECYLQLSDLLMENGDFHESKKYTDLASGVIE